MRQVRDFQDGVNAIQEMHDAATADRDDFERRMWILADAMEEIESGCCDENHPPECCDCAMKLASKALKDAEI
jgi:hypothetical protein